MQINWNLHEIGLPATSSGKGSSSLAPAKPLYCEVQHVHQQETSAMEHANPD